MKALCDVLDVNCYYTYSDNNVRQWNLVEVDRKWYIVNVPASMDGQKGYTDGQVGLAGYGEHPAASD